MEQDLCRRAMALLERQGWIGDLVERRIKRDVTCDYLGIGDVLMIRGKETLLLQITSRANHATRIRKAIDSPHLVRWLNGRKFAVGSFGELRDGVERFKLSELGVVNYNVGVVNETDRKIDETGSKRSKIEEPEEEPEAVG